MNISILIFTIYCLMFTNTRRKIVPIISLYLNLEQWILAIPFNGLPWHYSNIFLKIIFYSVNIRTVFHWQFSMVFRWQFQNYAEIVFDLSTKTELVDKHELFVQISFVWTALFHWWFQLHPCSVQIKTKLQNMCGYGSHLNTYYAVHGLQFQNVEFQILTITSE